MQQFVIEMQAQEKLKTNQKIVKQLPRRTTTPIPIVAKLLLSLWHEQRAATSNCRVSSTEFRMPSADRFTVYDKRSTTNSCYELDLVNRQHWGQAEAQSKLVRWAAQSRCSALERQY